LPERKEKKTPTHAESDRKKGNPPVAERGRFGGEKWARLAGGFFYKEKKGAEEYGDVGFLRAPLRKRKEKKQKHPRRVLDKKKEGKFSTKSPRTYRALAEKKAKADFWKRQKEGNPTCGFSSAKNS